MNMDIQAALELADETDAFMQISDLIFEKEKDQGFDNLTHAEKNVFCIDGYLREMGSGGVSNLIGNEYGQLLSYLAEALGVIKADKSKKLLDQLVNLGSSVSQFEDEEVRHDWFLELEENHSDLLSELDDDFYKNEEAIVKNTLKYVTKNLKDFN